MSNGCCTASAWQNETAERRQGGADSINFLFEEGYHLLSHDVARTHVALGVVGGEVSSYDKELALDVSEGFNVVLLGAVCDKQANL